jgi:glycosyltransferase involved in cell wall biosynthesis
MSCAVPCVMTDVGDSPLIVGQTGRIVPPRNPNALSAALLELVELGREGRSQLGIAARQRIKEHFGLRTLSRDTKTSTRNSRMVCDCNESVPCSYLR